MSPLNKTLFIPGPRTETAGLLAQPQAEIEFRPRMQTGRDPLSLTVTLNYNASRLTRISLLLLAFIVTSPAVSASADTTSIPHGIRHYAVGPTPLSSPTNMDGEKLALRDSRGHWVFADFRAS